MTTHNGISLEGLPQAKVVTLYCEDKMKGFGFQIENRKELDSEVYKVIVSNITRGGAADTSGQLLVGDWILSVGGTSTLGYAVQKVMILIYYGILLCRKLYIPHGPCRLAILYNKVYLKGR